MTKTLPDFLLNLSKDYETKDPVISQDLRLAAYDLQDLKNGLDESVKLQGHYAELLNMYDGGQRIIFQSADEWILRLNKLKKNKEQPEFPTYTDSQGREHEEF